MSAIPGLQKKLKSVRATGKLSKAMKTVSAAKYAKLAALQSNYALYAEQYRFLYQDVRTDRSQPAQTVVICGSNRGFCGGFNNDMIAYLKSSDIWNTAIPHLIVCGEEIIRLLTGHGFTPEKTFVFHDTPSFSECAPLFTYLEGLAGAETDYPVRIIRPMYKNTMTQTPGEEIMLINPSTYSNIAEERLLIPDKETVLRELTEKGLHALLYGAVLDTALGAQAATLMTMRSAYDTAREYAAELEGEIHRQRQRDVTADVIETASERGAKGDEDDE